MVRPWSFGQIRGTQICNGLKFSNTILDTFYEISITVKVALVLKNLT